MEGWGESRELAKVTNVSQLYSERLGWSDLKPASMRMAASGSVYRDWLCAAPVDSGVANRTVCRLSLARAKRR